MDRLPCWLESQNPHGGPHGRRSRPATHLMLEQPGECLDDHLPQALPLSEQPFLKRRLLHAYPLEEVALVERGGLREGARRAVSHQGLESHDLATVTTPFQRH